MTPAPKHRWFRWWFAWHDRRRLRRARLSLAKQQQQQQGHTLHDPIEDDPSYQAALSEAESLVELELAGRKRGCGFCHLYWVTKQRVLRDQFGIEWFSPADLNPFFFD